MGWHILLAIPTIWTVAGGVNFSHDTLADQGTGGWDTRWIEYFLHYADKFMTQHSLKAHIAAGNFQVGVADTCLQDADQGFTFHEGRVRIMRFKREGMVIIN